MPDFSLAVWNPSYGGNIASPGYYCTAYGGRSLTFYGPDVPDKAPTLTITYEIPTPTIYIPFNWGKWWPMIVGIPTSVLIVVIGYMYQKWFPTRKSSYYKQDVWNAFGQEQRDRTKFLEDRVQILEK